MIHKFAQGGLYFVLDINSGAVHIVDEMVYDILDYYPKQPALDVIRALMDKYDEADIREALTEVEELISADQLYSEDLFPMGVKRQPVIKALCLHIAHDCNIRCDYCFASQGDFQGDRSLMSFEVGKKALDLLIERSANRRNLEVDFFGGEPLMNFGVVKQLVEYGRSLEKIHHKNFRFTITTNGVLLDDDKIDYINQHMNNVVLSIDGRKAVNDKMRHTITGGGTYDMIVDKFKKLIEKRNGKSYYARGTYTNQNKDFAADVLHLADQGFHSVSVEPVIAKECDYYALRPEDLPELLEQYEILADEMIKNKQTAAEPFQFFHFAINLDQGPCIVKRISGCGAGAEYLAITPEGDIYPCHQFVGNADFLLGNVLEGTLNQSLVSNFNVANVYTKEKCRSCWAKFYCSGGCHANAYNFNDDIFIPYELGCELEKKRIECSIYIEGKLREEDEHCEI